MARILVTGGAGFIGSNYIEYILQNFPQHSITNLDKLTYAGFQNNITPFEQSHPERYRFVWGDVNQPWMVLPLVQAHDWVIHFAAESNVDLSIESGAEFLSTNIQGTKVILDACRKAKTERILVVSTDEVYGNAWQDRPSEENDPLMPCSPYAASKAAQDLLAFSYYETFGLPIVRTRCANNYGPRQDPTKLIPRFILHAMHDQALPIYGHGKNTRDWIHVLDHCKALHQLLEAVGEYHGEVFNIGSDCEKNVLEMTDLILKALDKPQSLKSFVADRPGHVRRHAVNSQKIEQTLNWRPEMDFAQGIAHTIEWYLDHPEWWRAVVKKQAQVIPNYESHYPFQSWIKL